MEIDYIETDIDSSANNYHGPWSYKDTTKTWIHFLQKRGYRELEIKTILSKNEFKISRLAFGIVIPKRLCYTNGKIDGYGKMRRKKLMFILVLVRVITETLFI